MDDKPYFGKWGNNAPYKSKGNWSSNNKPPRKGKLCIQIAPFAAWPALLMLANAIAQSFIS
jgi:hypothetical protein